MSASIGFHAGVTLDYTSQSVRALGINDTESRLYYASIYLHNAAEHRGLAKQLREAAATLDSAADELERTENPCESCGGRGEVNPSWNNDPQSARDCGFCGATGVAHV